MINLDKAARASERRRKIELWTELASHFAAGFAISALAYTFGWYRRRAAGRDGQ